MFAAVLGRYVSNASRLNAKDGQQLHGSRAQLVMITGTVHGAKTIWPFLEIEGPFFAVLIVRTIVCWGSFWGPLILQTPIFLPNREPRIDVRRLQARGDGAFDQEWHANGAVQWLRGPRCQSPQGENNLILTKGRGARLATSM